MADRLASRGMQHHPACLMCDQAQETTNHLLLLCVFTLQIWFSVFIQLHMAVDVPGNWASFLAWWRRVIRIAPKELRKGLNSLIILVVWEIWKHRNACVFEDVLPNTRMLLQAINNECTMWRLTGASNLRDLLARLGVLGRLRFPGRFKFCLTWR